MTKKPIITGSRDADFHKILEQIGDVLDASRSEAPPAAPMSPTRLRECLDAIGWTQRGLAWQLDVHETRTRRWASGRYPVPPQVAGWLECIAEFHEQHPPPPPEEIET